MVEAASGTRLAEITTSHSGSVDAQCYRLHAAPPLGSLVRIGSPPVFAIVREIWHEPIDPTRPLAPRGEGMETEDAIYAANPQLSSMLATRFRATIIGYQSGTSILNGLPPSPPNLHAFVFECEPEEIRRFALDLGWLRLAAADRDAQSDVALVSLIRTAAGLAPDGRGLLLQAGKALAFELSGEPQRLQWMLRELGR